MEWTNAKSLEFLKLFRNEPCLWDLKLQSNKNRSLTYEAWRRIIKSLSFSVSCDELKKKKESLMGYYRIHFNKYKKSLKTGNVYTTNWFAFEFMDSFLGPVYARKSLSNPEFNPEENNSDTSNESVKEDSQRSNPGIWNDSHEEKSNERTQSASRNIRTLRFHQRPKTGVNANKQMNYACQKVIAKRKQYDEYDHFAFMIASKIRKIDNADDKEELMNAIHNLTFQFYMKNRRSKSRTEDPLNTALNIKFSPHSVSD